MAHAAPYSDVVIASNTEHLVYVKCAVCTESAKLAFNEQFKKIFGEISKAGDAWTFQGQRLTKFALLKLITRSNFQSSAEQWQQADAEGRSGLHSAPSTRAARDADKPSPPTVDQNLCPLLYADAAGVLHSICSSKCLAIFRDSTRTPGGTTRFGINLTTDQKLAAFRAHALSLAPENSVADILDECDVASWPSLKLVENLDLVTEQMLRAGGRWSPMPEDRMRGLPLNTIHFSGAVGEDFEDSLIMQMADTSDNFEAVLNSYRTKHPETQTPDVLKTKQIWRKYERWYRKKHGLQINDPAPVPVPVYVAPPPPMARRSPPPVRPRPRRVLFPSAATVSSASVEDLTLPPPSVMPFSGTRSFPASMPRPGNRSQATSPELFRRLQHRATQTDPIVVTALQGMGHTAQEAEQLATILRLTEERDALKAAMTEIERQWAVEARVLSGLRGQLEQARARIRELEQQLQDLQQQQLEVALAAGRASATLRDGVQNEAATIAQLQARIAVLQQENGAQALQLGQNVDQLGQLQALLRLYQGLDAIIPRATPRTPHVALQTVHAETAAGTIQGDGGGREDTPLLAGTVPARTYRATTRITHPGPAGTEIEDRSAAMLAYIRRLQRRVRRQCCAIVPMAAIIMGLVAWIIYLYRCEIWGTDCPPTCGTPPSPTPPPPGEDYVVRCDSAPGRWMLRNCTLAFQYFGDLFEDFSDRSNIGNATVYANYQSWMMTCFANATATYQYVFDNWNYLLMCVATNPVLAAIFGENPLLLLLMYMANSLFNATGTAEIGAQGVPQIEWQPYQPPQ